MKILKPLSLAVMAAILVVGCNKEDMNKQETPENNTKNADAPKMCSSFNIVDENGLPMQPAELSPAMYAAAEMTKADVEYTIPVVFHVFGDDQSSGKLDGARFEKVLKWINNDFNGVKNVGDIEYFGTIDESRKEFVDYLPIKFVLAKYTKDGVALKNGQKVSGGKVLESSVTNSGTISGDVSVIIYSKSHPLAKRGPGNNNAAANNEMKKIAWDNKMYMNVYITNDLYANGDKYNSGVAWYPDASMTNANVARVVYNGSYLPGGSYGDRDFTSVISHEFGHFMNLIHTFYEDRRMLCGSSGADGGSYGDKCADTPEMQCSSDFAAYYGHGKKNCHGEVIDFGNFMNYGVYCNFTKDQVKRMKAALQHVTRKSLWQQANLDKVLGNGLKDPATFGEKLQDINNKLGK